MVAAAGSRKAVVALASLSLSLAIACIVLAVRGRSVVLSPSMLADEEVRQLAIAELMARSGQIFDTHPDATVGRVLSPYLQGVIWENVPVRSNRYGMREKDYEMPKPDDVLRVVLLGDSYVFGMGAPAEIRLGAVLERELIGRRRGGLDQEVEVLHIGIPSWNTKAECAFLLHQLDVLDPDLVVQIFVANDLDDNATIRGGGSLADFDPAYPERCNSRVLQVFPTMYHDGPDANPLLDGYDYESRSRYGEAAAAVARLEAELDRRGTPYVLFSTVGNESARVMLRWIGAPLEPNQLLFIDWQFMSDTGLLLDNGHWNRVGNRRLARLLYACIEQRGLLPELELEEWDQSLSELATLHEAALARIEESGRPRMHDIHPSLESPRQIYGGIHPGGDVAPYASVVLEANGREVLEVVGSFLPRPELDGGTVEVYADEVLVGRLVMQAGENFDERFPLTDELARREYVAVRFVSDTWYYSGEWMRTCISFQLDTVGLVEAD